MGLPPADLYPRITLHGLEGTVLQALKETELLSTEQSLIAADAATATSDAALVQDQIAVFKSLGGGWQSGEN